MLEGRNLCLNLGGRALLQDVSLTVAPGELTVVLGPNGAGKSSLLSLLSGLRAPSGGEAKLAGQALSRFDAARMASHRALLEQHPATPDGWTCRELIAAGGYACRGVARERLCAAIEQALALTCCQELADTALSRLSGGERQRAQLAKALCQLLLSEQDERYLLLDEPTSALDFAMADGLLAQVRAISRQHRIGALAVVHDLNLAMRHADQVLLLNDGRAAGFGPSQTIMQRERLEAVYGVRLAELTSPDQSIRAFVPLPPAGHAGR
nr:ATP-binding cassette domain-containing protein [Chromobacterium sp. ASV5]